MNKTPKLRFKEFSGDWESVKIDEVFSQVRNGFVGTATPYYVEDGVPYLQSNNIRKNKIDKRKIVYINEAFHEKNKKSILRKDDILMVQSGHAGECAVVTEEFENSNCHALIVMTPTKHINSTYCSYYINSEIGQKRIYKLITGNTIKHILASEIKAFNIIKPELEEQEKISSFFSLIDDKISLQGEKVEALKDYKKGMMQKIFSRELRFKDDDGRDYPEWEEKRLDEIVEFLRGKELSKSDISQDGNIPCILYGELFTQYDSVIDKIKSRCIDEKGTVSKKFDILMPTSDVTPEGLATASCIMMDNVFLGGDINILRPYENINGIFLSYQINYFKNYIINRVSGTTVKHIYVKDIKDIEYFIPCELEQRKISNLLVKIDIKIKTEQDKLEQLNEYKKGLLQQMFV